MVVCAVETLTPSALFSCRVPVPSLLKVPGPLSLSEATGIVPPTLIAELPCVVTMPRLPPPWTINEELSSDSVASEAKLALLKTVRLWPSAMFSPPPLTFRLKAEWSASTLGVPLSMIAKVIRSGT